MAQGHAAKRFIDRKVFYAGDKIFKEGEPGDRAYIVERGMVEIFKMIDGKEVVLGTINKGGIFGEMALIDNSPRMAAARAVQQTTLVIITRDVFESKLAKADPFVRGLINIFVKNIRRMGQELAKYKS
ncbi:cyclic nucleotide-binding domain-containing protein [Terasakiella sp. A23]|uniref:cyclic nucleotide-binding domain-containing protein n=1 Tax=Terasakiella sp. FCG-A23 TaxID=3080561 RepID=UPI002952F7A8|nr:cyclic nucleotide-binding domain-containing protein [Terasakiella sp. A23]MDV7340306.1 cyclic nucleotide-binding domain-containing protein [Terasakiella sp. A23]